ncbi:Response regulator protein TmoT [Pseudomonas fluorescens]|uniref:Response regulator protein TmoT n=1 Tax=Pseudomonas fluorescens TaxID=294 RepID=A0A5E6WUM1_PSEFL|nr:response regulator [Pseudomonas fluorescens]VVN32858.1 Response regulator protein TmoT [Pseudomonas fluorescens]
MPHTAVVSVVDDDESVRIALDSLLRSNGYTVRVYANAEDFLTCDRPQDTGCLISDIQMPGMSGIQMYEALAARGIRIPVIFITGYQGSPPRVSGNTPEPVAFFPKPFPCGELIACVEKILKSHA